MAGECIEADHVAISQGRLEPGRIRLEMHAGQRIEPDPLVPGGLAQRVRPVPTSIPTKCVSP